MKDKFCNPPQKWNNDFENYNNLYSSEILNLLNHFNPDKNHNSPLNYNTTMLSNASTGCLGSFQSISLFDTDFKSGTYRIKFPGIYKLSEDIIFHPNESNDFFPNNELEYPTNNGPYTLGFFAAITIECDNVIIDLNGKSIRQSNEFYLKQRFFSLIELASSPFIHKQGPANFGNNVIYSKNVIIQNGYLGLTSHYGIHGNGCENLILQNLNFYSFEVAGISINGTEVLLGRNLNLSYGSNDVKVFSTYTASRFIMKFLNKLLDYDNKASVKASFKGKTINSIINNLKLEMLELENAVTNNKPLPENNMFANHTGISDCNMYGILLNPLGVAVGKLRENRNGAIGNKNICLHDINIENLKCNPVEIRGVNSVEDGVYNSVQIGPVGDVIQIDNIIDTTTEIYTGTVLSDAQFILAKYSSLYKDISGKSNIDERFVQWAENNEKLSDFLNCIDCHGKKVFYIVGGIDSMGHNQKGNVGLFLSSVEDCITENINIKYLENDGPLARTNSENTGIFRGTLNTGIFIAGCYNVTIAKFKVCNLRSVCGNSCAINIFGESENINMYSFQMEDIRSSNFTVAGKYPNISPLPEHVVISKESKNVNVNL